MKKKINFYNFLLLLYYFSDDESIFSDLKNQFSNNEFKIHTLTHATYTNKGGFQQRELRGGVYNQTLVAQQSLIDIAVLSKCQAFVGTVKTKQRMFF